MSIWQLAADKLNEQTKKRLQSAKDKGDGELETEDENAGKDESHILLFGDKSSGKTALVMRFLDRDEPTKPTIALEYTYGRRTRGNNKDVAHIWELGGGPHLYQLLDVPINSKNIETLALVIMIDLSQPDQLWLSLESSLMAASSAIESVIKQLKPTDSDLKNRLTKRAWDRVKEDHPDQKMINPFLVPLAIIGGKYDVFQNLDPEQRKIICKTLRFVAHSHGAILQFFSLKVESLVTRGRALMSHLVFGTAASKGISIDHNKPIFVPFGGDSFQDIGAPPGMDTRGANSPMEMWKNGFCSTFPQKTSKIVVPDDPCKDPQYKDEIIDLLRAQKDQDLQKYLKQRSVEKRLQITVE